MSINQLIKKASNCNLCEEHLPLGPRPIFRIHPNAKILIVGQAPGTKVHETGIPWNDESGKRLREWMGLDSKDFYNSEKVAIMPMGFCYPGKGKSGDLPPRPECANLWHKKMLHHMKEIKLIILIGKYALQYYLGERIYTNLTETVRNYQKFIPEYFPIVHPSPRNKLWIKKNPWFEESIVPELQKKIHQIL